MIRRPPRSTLDRSSAASDVYKRQDAYNTFILRSVKVYAQTAGTRTIELSDNAGTLLQSTVVNVNAGMTVVDLDFMINPGTGYQLSRTGGELFRNNDANGLSFPYNIDNFCSITGTSQGAGYYYFFYDWSVDLPSNTCVSQRTAATAVSYTHLRAHETVLDLVCRLLLEKKNR